MSNGERIGEWLRALGAGRSRYEVGIWPRSCGAFGVYAVICVSGA